MKKSFNDERRNRIEQKSLQGTTFSPSYLFLISILLFLHNNNYNNSTSLVTKYRQQLMDKSRKEELYYNRSFVCFQIFLARSGWSGFCIFYILILYIWMLLNGVERRFRGGARIKPIYLSEKTLTVLGNFLYAIKLQFQNERTRKGNEKVSM